MRSPIQIRLVCEPTISGMVDAPMRPVTASGRRMAVVQESGGFGPVHGATGFAPVASIGWNNPCPCGSGKKYKKCCQGTGSASRCLSP